jgi:hypothetical protein
MIRHVALLMELRPMLELRRFAKCRLPRAFHRTCCAWRSAFQLPGVSSRAVSGAVVRARVHRGVLPDAIGASDFMGFLAREYLSINSKSFCRFDDQTKGRYAFTSSSPITVSEIRRRVLSDFNAMGPGPLASAKTLSSSRRAFHSSIQHFFDYDLHRIQTCNAVTTSSAGLLTAPVTETNWWA